MADLDKVKVARVLADSAQALRSVSAERDKLASENYQMKRHFEAQKLAGAMHAKGINLDVDTDTLVSNLEKAAEDGRLPAIQEAVEMVAPNMGITGTGTITSDEAFRGGSNSLESFILGGVG